jgi:hypothetical protein
VTRIRDTWADNDSPVLLELYYSGGWNDVTADLSQDGVQITRGRAEWAGEADPSEMTLTLNNAGGKYSPRNPGSSLFGLIGRNTPIQFSVTTGGVNYVRFVGEVTAWPQEWTLKGTCITKIKAAGVTCRLGQGASPLQSVYRRGCTSKVAPVEGLIAYWPCEDPVGSTSLASGIPGATPMTITGTPTLASDGDSFACSDPLPDLGSASLSGIVPNYASTGQVQVRCLMAIPAAGTTNGAVLFSVRTGGTAERWELVYGTGGTLALNAYDGTGASLLSTAPGAFGLDGAPLRLDLELAQDGSDVDYTFSVLPVGAAVGTYSSGTLSSQTVTVARAVVLAPNKNMGGVTGGQVTVQSAVTSIWDLSEQLYAYDGEEALYRIYRLATEEGLDSGFVYDTEALSAKMGPQRSVALLDLLQDSADADLGALFEPRTKLGIAYRTRDSICSQDPVLTIPYTDNLLLPFRPVEDYRSTRNLVTVARDGGSQATSEVTSGPLNTSDPTDDPQGVGRYDEKLTLSLWSDSQVANQATWRTHVGTVDEARWPQIGIELAHPTFRASTSQTAAALALDIGDRLLVTDLPAWLPPDDVDQIVAGYTETITPARYTIVANCTPYTPYRVAVYDDADSRYSGDGTVLAEDLDSTETGVDVTAPDGVSWEHDDGDYVVLTGGETMTVTGVALTNLRNPTLDASTTDWWGNGGTLTHETTVTHSGAGSAKLVTGAGSDPRIEAAANGLYPVQPGDTATASVWLRADTARTLRLDINWFNTSSTFVSKVSTTAAVAANTWTQFTLTATAPAGAAGMDITGTNDGTPGAGRVLYLDDASLTATRQQTLTVVRSVNGVAKTHSSGAAIDLASPVYYGM